MCVWKEAVWEIPCGQKTFAGRFRALVVLAGLVTCGMLGLSVWVLPDSGFAMSLEREFIQDLTIMPASKEPQIIKVRQHAMGYQSNERTLFDVYLDEERPLVKGDVLQDLEDSVELMQIDSAGAFVIEVYCDRRGSGAYSLALGHRRAMQLHELVQNLEISGSYVHSVSYGKESPQCQEASRRCWEENVRIQSTFRYLAIGESKLGCLGRVRIQGQSQKFSGTPTLPFLQKIRLAPPKPKRSSVMSFESHHQ
ncbi:MAG: hypothetical protein NPIRA02_41700 [Nitrospirales bacterium]|nr:MAG: hypothetical protein NPIRA02_41700 [Nitrospirales bacterium]